MSPQHSILYITPGLPIAGAEKFLASLCNNFAEQGTVRQTLVSLSDNNPMRDEFSPSVAIHIWPRQSKTDWKPIRQLRHFLKTENPDAVFCINFFSYFIFKLAAAGTGWTGNCIISYHSTIHLNKKEHWLHKLYFSLLGKNDRIITVSENQAAYTIEAYGLPKEKFQTIHNGIDTAYWKPRDNDAERLEIRQKFAIPVNAELIILTAGFREEKNHAGAIQALNILHQKYNRHAYLLFVGGGPREKEVQAAIDASPVSGFIHKSGIQKAVRPFYQSADLFTLTSTAVETFSIAALEAMACGLPAVLTNIGGASEMIEEGTNGYLCGCTPEDIAEAWNKALEKRFNNAAIHQWIKNRFSLNAMTTAYAQQLFEQPAHENSTVTPAS